MSEVKFKSSQEKINEILRVTALRPRTMALKLGMSPSAISKISKGETRKISANVARLLTTKMNISPKFIESGTGAVIQSGAAKKVSENILKGYDTGAGQIFNELNAISLSVAQIKGDLRYAKELEETRLALEIKNSQKLDMILNIIKKEI